MSYAIKLADASVPKGHPVTMILEPDLHEYVQAEAGDMGLPVATWIRLKLRDLMRGRAAPPTVVQQRPARRPEPDPFESTTDPDDIVASAMRRAEGPQVDVGYADSGTPQFDNGGYPRHDVMRAGAPISRESGKNWVGR